MNDQHLIDNLCQAASASQPARADILALQPLGIEALRARARRFLSTLHEAGACPSDRADLAERGERSVLHLPEGARAVVYHASGALQYVSGLAPLEAPFERLEETAVLQRQLNEAAQRLNVASWAAEGGSLAFERLWQTKARGADRTGRFADPLLVRATGAWRHALGGIPVLGAASVAITLAGSGAVAALAVNLRPLASEVLDSAIVLAPEVAARHVVERLSALLGRSKEPLPRDLVESATMRFGYLDLGRRKAQHVLAPAYVAQVALRHAQERQAYVIAVQGTERHYLELPLYGTEAVLTRARGEHCKPNLA
jgi:hypothetical protein